MKKDDLLAIGIGLLFILQLFLIYKGIYSLIPSAILAFYIMIELLSED